MPQKNVEKLTDRLDTPPVLGTGKAWLGGAMIEGMDAVINCMGRAPIPVEVEARTVRSWGEKESTP